MMEITREAYYSYYSPLLPWDRMKMLETFNIINSNNKYLVIVDFRY